MSSTQSDSVAGSLSSRRAPSRRSDASFGQSCSPFHPSSAVPFSWEHRPGIPKSPDGFTTRPTDPLLPLPPSLRSASAARTGGGLSRKKRAAVWSASDDPFAAALVECAKDASPNMDELFPKIATVGGPRRAAATASAWSISNRLGLVGLYGSCRATCEVSHASVRVPRSRIRTGRGYDLSTRRLT